MIRLVRTDGAIQEYDGWERARGAGLAPESVLDADVGLPEAAQIGTREWRWLASAMADCALVRVEAIGRRGPDDAPNDAARRDAEGCGLRVLRETPVAIREGDWLARRFGLRPDLFGCEHVGRRCGCADQVLERAARSPSRRRLRLGIVTLDLYYSFIYESPSLAAHFDIRTVQCMPFSGPDYYRSLIEFDPQVLLVFRPDYLTRETFSAFRCPKIGFASEPLPRRVNGEVVSSEYSRKCYDLLLPVRGQCDALYHYDAACVDFLRAEDYPVSGLFPPCVAADVYRPDPSLGFRWDACFIGKSTPYRERFLNALHLVCKFFHGAHGLTGADELLPFLQRSRVGLNLHRDETPNLEPRLLILMSAGLPILTHPLPENPWFSEGAHYAVFRTEQEFVDQVRYFLAHDEERRKMGERGRQWVLSNANAAVVLPLLIRSVL
jgi:hypothetical protein